MKSNNKNKLLLFGFILLLYICYAYAVSNTIHYYKEYANKQEEIARDNNIPKLVGQLKQKEKQLDQVLAHYNISVSESFQNDLLKLLTAYSDQYHLKIVDFQEPHIISEKNLKTTSYIFSLEGSFNGCLALLNKIENTDSLGDIKHLNFTKTRNFKTNTDFLRVEVVMQKNSGL